MKVLPAQDLLIVPALVVVLSATVYFVHTVVRENMNEDLEKESQRLLFQPEEGGATYLASSWNNYRLYTYKWTPVDPPRAMVFISHGVTEHIGRYKKLTDLLYRNGIIVCGHDHVGHGHSDGRRCHVELFQTYIQDVIQHLEEMRREHPELPIFLMGHSMGALIAANVALERGDLLHGLILSSPPLIFQSPYPIIGPLLKHIVWGMAYILPRVKILPVDNSWISTVPDEVKEYAEDPLVYHGRARFGWTAALINALEDMERSIREMPTIPLLIFHGTEDMLVPIPSSEFAYETLRHTHQDLEYKRFEGCKHEVLHDKDQENARELIKTWIHSHIN